MKIGHDRTSAGRIGRKRDRLGKNKYDWKGKERIRAEVGRAEQEWEGMGGNREEWESLSEKQLDWVE